MKKYLRIALFILLTLFCVACGKEEDNRLLQGEHVPGTSEANLPTPTKAPVSTNTPTPSAALKEQETEPTVIPAPTTAAVLPMPGQEEVDGMTPLITVLPEEPAFMELYRVMPAGTKIDAEGITEEELGYCFCVLALSDRLQSELEEQAEQNGQKIQSLCCVRVLHYRSDGNLYIADVVTEETGIQDVKDGYYSLFVAEEAIDTWTEDDLPANLTARGYKAVQLQPDGMDYLLIYK